VFLGASYDPSRGPAFSRGYHADGPYPKDIFAKRPFRKAIFAKQEAAADHGH
jgi:hypothetical protein